MKTLIVLALVLGGPRNIFQYVEDPARPTKKRPDVAAAAPAAVVVIPPEKPATGAAVAPSFEFPYRYIGSFGPTMNPIAVFVGETVVTARVGDVIGDAVVVREIGIERVIVSRGDIAKSIALAE